VVLYQALDQAGVAHFASYRCGTAATAIACVSIINTAGVSLV